MIPRLARVVALLALAAPALAVLPAADASTPGRYAISGPSRFSPNGDGIQDAVTFRYRLPERTHVRLTIGPARNRTVQRRVDLGWQPAGTHTWTWNGRNQSGKVVIDRAYVIRLFDTDPGEGFFSYRAIDKVQVDTHFDPTLTAPTYGASPGVPARVYPRSTVVEDALPITANVWDNKVEVFELVIRSSTGRVVRRADLDERRTGPNGPSFGTGRTVGWAAIRGGKPLPKGRYTAVASGRDLAGNTGRSEPLRIWVSDDELEWQERTETVTPVETSYSEPCLGSGCGDYLPCGSVAPSSLFAEGLSYRSVDCTGEFRYPLATRSHRLLVPGATGVRGVAEARVGFTGAPTTAGEGDVGELALGATGAQSVSVVSSTGAETPWVTNPSGGAGRTYYDEDDNEVVVPAGVGWSFTTRGSDSVDVDRFTVSYRFLAPAA
ncbi:FlgD immunoglobulin-like domain containing protein [Nocardioides baculatus]|uniref:FlgD/Vpr Ig-like domain-containing protein n=1 Tax=Nocardioides baculatus TaxID=2801337 RepID=A0ABS1L5A7_9ACTN|nr:FlgD immunoglobulin-like domain containing protein [Nocardioides baculatus]MBL0746876.1 hypothetical protein [Nocardioides baculatus]